MDPQKDIFLTPAQAAEIINVSLSTFKKFIYKGKIKTLKTPGGHHRIRKSDLFEMIDAATTPAQFLKSIFIFWLLALSLALPASAYCYNHKTLDFKVYASASEGYDSNITQAHQNEQKDAVTNLSFGLGARYEGKTRSAELAARINRQIFAKYNYFNKTSEELTLDIYQEFSRYSRISLKDAFSHTYEPGTFEEAFGRTTGWYSHYRNAFDLGYARDISKQANISVKYANELDKFAREGLSDSYLNRIGGGFSYSLSSRIIFSLSYDFSNRSSDPGTNAYTHAFASAVRHYFTEQLYLDAKAGLSYINSYNHTKYTKPLFLVSLTDEIDKNTRSSLVFKKEYYTNAYSQDVFDYWEIAGILNKQLLERLSCSLSAFYGHGEYIASNITDKLFGCSIGLNYSFNEHLKGNLNYNYSTVSSTTNTREYSRNKIFLGLNMEF